MTEKERDRQLLENSLRIEFLACKAGYYQPTTLSNNYLFQAKTGRHDRLMQLLAENANEPEKK